jgi:hypothetical protein
MIWKKVGTFEGTRVYESRFLTTIKSNNQGLVVAKHHAGIALPPLGVGVGIGTFSQKENMELVYHEFGHILQARKFGLRDFYGIIAPLSLFSAIRDGIQGHSHRTFWTEVLANQMAYTYFDCPNTWSASFPLEFTVSHPPFQRFTI